MNMTLPIWNKWSFIKRVNQLPWNSKKQLHSLATCLFNHMHG